jgi:soluble lytic murein transglycosylase-like protein
MEAKNLVRRLVRELIQESSDINQALLGSVKGNPSIVLGPQARKFLEANGLTTEEVSIVFNRINNIGVSDFKKYDQVFRNHASAHGLKPSLLKAMSIEETTLGLSGLSNTSGSTAAGLIQITKPTLETLNANLPKGVHYDYEKLFTDPGYSVKVAAHYIQRFLIEKKGLKDRVSILRAYKTGPDSDNYVKRVEAFKKFVDIAGL